MRYKPTATVFAIITCASLLGACQRASDSAQADASGAPTGPHQGSDTAAAVSDSAPAPPQVPAPARSELASTSWQLVEIQSMDDKTYVPDDRSKYTIAFGNDGRASLRVDCNRGSTTWTSSVPSELRFGEAIMMTKVACPSGSLYDRFVRDLPYVRTYTMKDGHLYLSLMADGAIYEFEPRAREARD